MAKFYCMTKTGAKPPKYGHTDFELAVAEAQRLHNLHKTDVEVLFVAAVIKSVEVPVTKTETQTIIDPHFKNDLPF